MKMSGAEMIIQTLIKEGVSTIFGYPGGANMPLYDALYDHSHELKHVLVRHEQGATHAAEGYARITGKPGVCFATSGPGATNLITGIADAMMDSIPMVCVTGQVAAHLLGSDAFQETDVIGITTPITKWNYQVTCAEEIPYILTKAFMIAKHGRPGPVVVDITKNAQIESFDFQPQKNITIPKFSQDPQINMEDVKKAAEWINTAERPYLLVGHGVLISQAEKEVKTLMEKGTIPAAVTLHGLSAVSCDHPLYVGMLGMHGNLGPNVLTNKADVIIAVGMRFDDRVTGRLSHYAPQAKIIHVDIDASEHNKNIKAHIAIQADAKKALSLLIPHIKKQKHISWLAEFTEQKKVESKVALKRASKHGHRPTMKDVIETLSKETQGEAIVVSDVGQNQMFSARYYQYKNPNSYITSGGLGTMGFALPAAIGVMFAAPKKEIYAIAGDGGIQMNIQELATVTQEKIPLKIIVMSNGYLGMVRQWQQLFFEKRYSFTPITGPDLVKVAEAYGIAASRVKSSKDLVSGIKKMRNHKGAYLLEVEVEQEDNIFPMVPAGASVEEVRLEE
jgi:acetolactate synthase-1/2/3 large subunit